jgi:hypothetical protein
MIAAAVIGAAIGYGIQVYNNYQSGYTGSEAWTENISAKTIFDFAISAPVLPLAAPEILAETRDTLSIAGANSGSVGLFTAGQNVSNASTNLSNYLYGASTAVETSSTIPNPNGRKGGPDHQAVSNSIEQEVQQNYGNGYSVESEFQVRTPGGLAQNRYMDKAVIDKSTGDPVAFYQVGRVTQGGMPVPREVQAMNDVIEYSQYSHVPMIYRPYNAVAH